MTNLDEFLQDYKESGEGEFHFDLEELQDYVNKQDHQEKIVIPAIRKIGFDQMISDLSKVLKYPGEY